MGMLRETYDALLDLLQHMVRPVWRIVPVDIVDDLLLVPGRVFSEFNVPWR